MTTCSPTVKGKSLHPLFMYRIVYNIPQKSFKPVPSIFGLETRPWKRGSLGDIFLDNYEDESWEPIRLRRRYDNPRTPNFYQDLFDPAAGEPVVI